ncbi:MAG TPA: non-homologous end-joining DNA ligase [Streptosporangiaceae bacterium]|nr:non-homologous end-joining DNA ligase [Streptosporangiaceae bacterium]
MSPEGQSVRVRVEDRVLTVTNLGKVLYPEAGFTKGQVIDYYLQVAPVMLPHIAGRPVTLKRYPNGVSGEYFYEKHAPAHRPDWVPTATVEAPSSGKASKRVVYVVAGDLPTLIWLANLACLEIHTPMWRVPHVGEPDRLMFDLDPGPPATLAECCRVALLLRPLLEERGLRPLAKTSGGKGMQLTAALSGHTSQQASELARGLAEQLEREHPELVVSRMTRVLRPGKVLIDWSQNNAKKNTVAPYSLRASEQPVVSTPVSWDEVSACRRPEDLIFTSDAVLDRVAGLGDLFGPLLDGQ